MNIPFVKPPITGNEIKMLTESINSGYHSGDGPFTKKVQELIEKEYKIGKCLLTTSCTDALEMCALLIGAENEDEVILPSYTFSSTALAFATHGFKPVFVDVNEENKNISIKNIIGAVTKKTKVIVVVHYAGIICDMDPIMDFAKKNKIVVVEDAAQAVNSKYKNRYAGSIGHLATYSFHATKSYSCGEGGAILINDKKYFKRANFLWEKGTDRSLVLAGVKNKYSWVDWGSSFLLSDILASLLYDQLKNRKKLQEERFLLHQLYFSFFSKKNIRHISIPNDVDPNYHAFWIELSNQSERKEIISKLKKFNINAYIGYVPLHSSPKGIEVGTVVGEIINTKKAGECLLRMPFYNMNEDERIYILEKLNLIFS